MSRHRVTPLRRIEPPPERKDDESSYSHIPVAPAFSVLATYKFTGNLKPRQWPEDTSENAEPSPEDGYGVDAAGTYTGENE